MLLEPVDGIRWEKEGVCAHCRKTFSYRPNKRFCSSNCRKRNNEGIKNSVFSLAKRRENGEFFERSLRLAEVVYSAPPYERLGIMKDLIAEARTGEDRQLMDILTNQKLLRPNPAHETWLFYKGQRSYCTIAQAANNYCKRFWKADARAVIYEKIPEPPTGELE